MLTKRYMSAVKNLPAIFQKIQDGTAPDKFTVDHLKKLGFTSSNDRAVIPLLKDLGLLNDDGTPAPRYHAYRDKSRSKAVLGEALRDAYADIFHLTEKPTKTDKQAIEGLFKSTHNTSDVVAERQAMTFLALLDLADIGPAQTKKEVKEETAVKLSGAELPAGALGLRYNIEIHLPATKDIEVYNAIFRSLKEHLL
jgi:hypothetical protein